MQTKLFSINEEDVVIAKDNHTNEEYYVVGRYDDCYEWDFYGCPVGKFMTWHRRYRIGTKHDYEYPSDFWVDVFHQYGREVADNLSNEEYEDMASELPDFVFYPIFMYEHSGIALSMSAFNDRWDSGQLGVFCADREEVEHNLGLEGLDWKERFRDYVKSVLEEYNEWMLGNVWTFAYAPVKELKESKETVNNYLNNLWEENLKYAIGKHSDGWCGGLAGDYGKRLREFCDSEGLEIVGILKDEDE